MRFKRAISTIHRNLIESEERYLRSLGWEVVEINGYHSTWKNPEFAITYSRQQALLIAKSKDQNFGLH